MKQDEDMPELTRVVQAPHPLLPADLLPANRPLSVVLKGDEDVEWVWSTLPNGHRYVSGYTIVKLHSRAPVSKCHSDRPDQPGTTGTAETRQP